MLLSCAMSLTVGLGLFTASSGNTTKGMLVGKIKKTIYVTFIYVCRKFKKIRLDNRKGCKKNRKEWKEEGMRVCVCVRIFCV